ncbi:MAG: M48 family metalloprotease [Deltaproteobacteria bacterium]|nr:M48 family metalloprotease [Deltaproteobacteria bacterium]
MTRHKLLNLLHSVLLLGGMLFLMGLLGWAFAGDAGLQWMLLMGAVLFLLTPRISPRLVLRMYGARPLLREEVPGLYRALEEIRSRADLPVAPELYYVPSSMLNAFSMGNRKEAIVALTDGLLRSFDMRRIAAILAHEVSHLRNRDLWIMNLSDVVSRVTSMFSLAGQILLILNLPLLLVSGHRIPWFPILVLILAPFLNLLLQLALSRTREFDADLDAAGITGDPEGLASALERMERRQSGFLERLFLPGRRDPHPSLLRTHPETGERVRRLRELDTQARSRRPLADALRSRATGMPEHMQRVERSPRWHVGGLWF